MQFGDLVNKIAWRSFLPRFIVVSNTLTWFPLIYVVFTDSINSLYISASESLIFFAFYYVGIACSAILGSVLCSRRREASLVLWMFAGIIVSALLITIPNNSAWVNMLISLSLGVSTGICLPSSLAYFADAAFVENRGIHGGVTYSAAGLGILLLASLFSVLDLLSVFLVLAAWRSFGLLAFVFTKRKENIQSAPRSPSYSSILRKRDISLYLFPWIMFCFVNFIEGPLLQNLFGDFFVFVGFLEMGLSGLFALVGGILADFVGRKRVIITGFVVLGIEYAVLSLFSEMPVSWYLYTVFDGIAWGMFASVFFMTLWGDLAGDHAKDKYYVIGGLPYLLASLLSILVKPYVQVIPLSTAFSLASFFLFMAVLPLMYAPETLPEKKIKERELEEYIKKAKKVKEKPL